MGMGGFSPTRNPAQLACLSAVPASLGALAPARGLWAVCAQ